MGSECCGPRPRVLPTAIHCARPDRSSPSLSPRFLPPSSRRSCNVARSYNDTLSKWCNTQRVRCQAMLAGATDVPMTREQFRALEGIGFNMSRKRKVYDRSVLDRKWDEK